MLHSSASTKGSYILYILSLLFHLFQFFPVTDLQCCGWLCFCSLFQIFIRVRFKQCIDHECLISLGSSRCDLRCYLGVYTFILLGKPSKNIILAFIDWCIYMLIKRVGVKVRVDGCNIS